MARRVPASFAPYTELQKRLPKGTPMHERQRLARELKAELARGGSGARTLATIGRAEPTARRRRNPGGPPWLLIGAAAAGLWWLHRQSMTRATPVAADAPTAQAMGGGPGCG